MNRPYYALAALVVVLAGSTVAVGPARCHSATAAAANSSRSLCGASARDVVVAAHLLVHFETGWEAGSQENDSASEQGCDFGAAADYSESCGYDPYRGERYDAEVDDAGTTAEERNTPPVCGGDELHCPYFGGCAVERYHSESFKEFVSDDRDDKSSDEACEQANQQWLAEQEACEQAASPCESWKTAPVATPDWISEYLNACMPSLEEQYAEAELQAARDAQAAEYGPSLPAAPEPEKADYSDEYESLYGLDAYLIPEADEEMEDVEADNGPVAWSLSRIFDKVYTMFGELLPLVEEEADEVYDAADEVLQLWNDFASHLALPRAHVDVMAPYGKKVDDSIFSTDEQVVEVGPALPVEAAQSREMLESLAGSLRAAGQLLLTVADGLEAEAGRVLSADNEDYYPR